MKQGMAGPAGKLIRLASAVKKDGWLNVLTGLGVEGKDKRLGAGIDYTPLQEVEVEHLYSQDDIAAKVVDLIPGEGTREWIDYTTPVKENESTSGSGLVADMLKEDERLDVRNKFELAWSWARLYGGAGIYVSAEDGTEDLKEPLNVERLRRIKTLTVLHRYELQPFEIQRNIDSPNFGLPETYFLNPRTQARSVAIHHSRIIRFDGSRLPRTQFESRNYWGDSVLTRLFNVLRNYNLAHDSAASVLQEFKVGILKLKGLADLIAQDEENFLKDRIEIMNLSKSVLNTVVIDGEGEDFQNLATPITGVDALLTKIDERLTAATGMPHNLILGDGPSGVLSGAGVAEKRQFSDFIRVHQENNLTKPIDNYVKLVQAQQRGPMRGQIDEDLTWSFRPLFQMTEAEQAELQNKQSQTDTNYFNIGVLSAEEIRKARFGKDEFSIDTKIDPDEDFDDDLDLTGAENPIEEEPSEDPAPQE